MKKLCIVAIATLFSCFATVAQAKSTTSLFFEVYYKNYLQAVDKLPSSSYSHDPATLSIYKEISEKLFLCLANIKTPEDYILLYSKGDGANRYVPVATPQEGDPDYSVLIAQLCKDLKAKADEYYKKMHQHKYYVEGLAFFNKNRPSFTATSDPEDGSLVVKLQLQKKAYDYTPSQLYWLLHFSDETMTFDFLEISDKEKEKAIEKIEKSSLPLDLFDLENE